MITLTQVTEMLGWASILNIGFSAGGLYARKYADAYPDDVFGLVLVDSAREQSFG